MDPAIFVYETIICETAKNDDIREACKKFNQYRNEPDRCLKKLSEVLQKKIKEHFDVQQLPRDVQ